MTLRELAGKPRRSRRIERRPNSNARGYDYTWWKFRGDYIATHPTCCDCGRLAEEVHHVKKVKDYPELRLTPENCMALCKRCHSIRTARGE